MQPASSPPLEAQWPDLVAAVSAAIDLEATARSSGALVRRRGIADGSMISGPGGRSKWRLHATYDPVAGRFTDLDLTDERGAEGFGRPPWQAGEVALGDRCYARPPALRQLLAAGADFIVRTGWTRLRLLEAAGAPLAWEPIFDALAPGEGAERAVAVDYSGQGGKSRGEAVFPARLVVLRLPPE